MRYVIEAPNGWFFKGWNVTRTSKRPHFVEKIDLARKFAGSAAKAEAYTVNFEVNCCRPTEVGDCNVRAMEV